MTLHYLQTARLNSTPLARHIDTPESYGEITREIKNAVASGDYESAIKWARKREAFLLSQRSKLSGDIHDDAKAIGKASGFDREAKSSREIREDVILRVVKENPGATANDIGDAIDRDAGSIGRRLSTMVKKGLLKVEWFKHPQSFRPARKFYATDKQVRTQRKPSPRRDKAVAFIRSNPGCTTSELAAHMQITTRAAGAFLSQIRKCGNLRSERAPGKGTKVPARHWIED